MKKAVSLILAVLMVLSLVPAAAAASAVITGKHDVTIYRVENNVTDYSTVLASKTNATLPATLSIEKPYGQLGLSQGGRFEGEVALAEVHVTLNGDFTAEGSKVTVNGEDAALVDEGKVVFFATLDKTGGVKAYKVSAETPYTPGDDESGKITENFTLYIDYTNTEKTDKTLNVQVAGVPENADYTAYMIAGKLYVDFEGAAHNADVTFSFTDENRKLFDGITYVNAVSGASNGEQKLNKSKATFTVEGGKLKFTGETAKNKYASVEIPVVFRENIQPGDPKGVYFANRTLTIRIGQTVTPAVKALNNVAFNYTLDYADSTSSAIAVDGKNVIGLKEGTGYIALTCVAGGNTYTDTMKIVVTSEVHEEPTAAYVTANVLNVRKGAGTAYGLMGKLTKGAKVQVLSVENGWAKIAYGNAVGYVSLNYLTFDEVQPEVHYVVCRALNVRPTAGIEKARVGVLYRGQQVQVLETVNGWAKIVHNGGTAYVSASYLSK